MFCFKEGKNVPKTEKPGETKEKKHEPSKETESKESSSQTSSAKPNQKSSPWPFGLFEKNGRPGGSSNKSYENGDKKLLLLGALGTVGVLGAIFGSDFNQKEITWREFTYK